MKTLPLLGLRPHLCGCLIILLQLVGPALHAEQGSGGPPPAARDMQEAHEFRGSLVTDIQSGRAKPQAILGKLRERKNAMGLEFEPQTDFALAAMDIGHRLIALGKAEEAEPFFVEAEKSIGQAIDKLPDRESQTKAMLLEHRAFIRDGYLNKSAEADADLEKAASLQPDDQRLHRKRALLPAGKTGRKEQAPKSN